MHGSTADAVIAGWIFSNDAASYARPIPDPGAALQPAR